MAVGEVLLEVGLEGLGIGSGSVQTSNLKLREERGLGISVRGRREDEATRRAEEEEDRRGGPRTKRAREASRPDCRAS